MPVFQEEASAEMLSREHGILEPALPRLTSPPPKNPNGPLADGAKHEVVVVGTGPAGMMLSLVLTRYGISVLSIDRQPTRVISGHADGIQPRTLEVLRQLGLSDEIFRQGNQNYRIAFWNPKKGGGIERTATTDDVTVPGRYPHKILLAAGRVVGILERQMQVYGGRSERGVELVEFKIREGEEYPVEATLKEIKTERVFKVYTKHLVGADGAHSKVRMGIGAQLVGENTDYIWGVVDAVVRTDFPDIRKRCAIHSNTGSIMCIPRERIENNKYLTRLYTQMEADVAAPPSAFKNSNDPVEMEKSYQRALAQRRAVTLPRILEQVTKTISPYRVEVEKVDWWAAYHIGQRVSDRFVMKDENGLERILIMGDACHTHSPKAGQGMNVSMMDAYNLGWKLAHELLGLCPRGSLLSTYEPERRAIAQQLIDFDNAFASKFSQKIGVDVTHEEFFKTFHTGGGFTSGCGIEYKPSILTTPTLPSCLNPTLDPDNGAIRPGRRLFSIPVSEFAGDIPTHLHDALPATGIYQLLLLLPATFLSPSSLPAFRRRTQYLGSTLPGRYVGVDAPAQNARGTTGGVVAPYIIHPLSKNEDMEWEALPDVWRYDWWGNVFGDLGGKGYETWGVDKNTGCVLVVRPDGVVGAIWEVEQLVEGGAVERWLDAAVRVRKGKNGEARL